MSICKKIYLKQLKSIFPVRGRAERRYLKRLRKSISEYCRENNTATLKDLYADIGYPIDVLKAYLSALDSKELLRYLSEKTFLRGFRITLCITIIAFLACSCIYMYNIYNIQQLNFRQLLPVFSPPTEMENF